MRAVDTSALQQCSAVKGQPTPMASEARSGSAGGTAVAAQADTIAIASHSALATSVPTSSGKDEGKPMPSAEYENLRAVL